MELKNPFLEIKRLRERIKGDDITDSFSEPLDPLDVIKIELEEVDQLPKTIRGSGGFGSTGK